MASPLFGDLFVMKRGSGNILVTPFPLRLAVLYSGHSQVWYRAAAHIKYFRPLVWMPRKDEGRLNMPCGRAEECYGRLNMWVRRLVVVVVAIGVHLIFVFIMAHVMRILLP